MTRVKTGIITRKEAISLTVQHWENILAILSDEALIESLVRECTSDFGYFDGRRIILRIKDEALDMMGWKDTKPAFRCFLCHYDTYSPNSQCCGVCPALDRWPAPDCPNKTYCNSTNTHYQLWCICMSKGKFDKAREHAEALVNFFRELEDEEIGKDLEEAMSSSATEEDTP